VTQIRYSHWFHLLALSDRFTPRLLSPAGSVAWTPPVILTAMQSRQRQQISARQHHTASLVHSYLWL
jgi:hypothetical protein